jgi:hypothetical protein
MESAEVVEMMKRPRTRKRGMELELGPRISNLGQGIEYIGIEKIYGKKTISDYFKMKIL